MSSIVLAIAAAALSGSADFFGGVAGRRGRLPAVVLGALGVGVAATAALAPLLGGSPTLADLAWGAASGVGGLVGVAFLYRGFARSRVGVVSPTAGVVTAGLPVTLALVLGERTSLDDTLGLLLGIVAIALVSLAPEPEVRGTLLSGVAHGVGAGVGFAGLLIFLSRVSSDAGIWPLLPSRLTGFVLLALVATVARWPRLPAGSQWPPVVAAGVLATLGNGAFLLAVQTGPLAIVSVLTSMFPAATVLLARIVLHERLTRTQLVGVGSALAAIGLIAA